MADKICAMPDCMNEATPGLKLCGCCRGDGVLVETVRDDNAEMIKEKYTGGTKPRTREGDNAVLLPPGKKRCSKCGAIKDLEDFFADKYRKDGRKSECKGCSKKTVINAALKTVGLAGSRLVIVDGGETAISTAALIDEEQTEKPDSLAPIVRRLVPLVTEHLKGDFAATALLIDMSAYPDVLDEIKRRAIDEDRTPEAQARWLLRRIIAQEEMKEIAA